MRSTLLPLFIFGASCSGAAPLTPDAGTRADAGADAGVIDGGSPYALPGLVLNEIAADGVPNDWFELYNAGDRELDLTGATFTDDLADPGKGLFASGTKIAPGEYYVRYLDDTDPGFKLSGEEEVGIFDATGALVDSVQWALGDSPAGKSFGRLPDITGPFTTLDIPTPGAANRSGAGCGDGLVESPEVCDGADLGGRTCESLGFTGGALACAPGCADFDRSNCTTPEVAVAINEVSSSGDDPIELFGIAPSVDLSGWYLVDGGYDPNIPNGDHRYDFGATQIAAGERLVLHKGIDHAFGLGDADSVSLYDAGDLLRDRVEWTAGTATVSYCRIPDGTGPFVGCEATFGAANSRAAQVVINEVTSEGDDRIELKNLGAVTIDLAGWSVADDGYDPLDPTTADHLFTVAASTVAADAYLVLVKGVDHAFGLGGMDGVRLFDPSGTLVDSVDWPDAAAIPSYCRIPDGTGAFTTCAVATFGGAN